MSTTSEDKQERIGRVLFSGFKLLALLFAPWVYGAFDDFRVTRRSGGANPKRLLWLVPLYYLVAGLVAVLLLTPVLSLTSVQNVPPSEVLWITLALPVFFLGYALGGFSGLSLGTIDLFIFGGVTVGASLVGYRQWQGDKYRRLRSLAGFGSETDVGQYVVPVSNVREFDGLSTREVTFKKNHSILVLGQPGVGKTESIRLLANQMQASDDEPFVVFDYKSEYRDDVFEDDDKIVLSLDDSTEHWNLFDEVENERELREIGRMLYPDEDDAGENVFFEKGARQIFVAALRAMYRDFEDPDNAQIREIFQKASFETLPNLFEGHHDLGGTVQEYMKEDNPRTSQSVFAFVTQMVEDVFIDDFAAEDGSFSIREYMEDPQGRKLILDMPQRGTQSVGPAFRFFIDRAIQLALEDSTRNAYFILDEFARVPELSEIENLTGAGRAQGAQAILGLQGVSQLRRHYDDDYADDILAGVTQEILMRPGDRRSTEYILERIGKQEFTTLREKPKKFWESDMFDNIQETVEERYPIPSGVVQRFDKGEGILMTEEGWERAQMPMWEQLDETTRRALSGEEPNTLILFGQNEESVESTYASVLQHLQEAFWDQYSSEGGKSPDSSLSDEDQAAHEETGWTTTVENPGQTDEGSYCRNCDATLSNYSEVNYCPQCGASTR